MYLNKFTYTIWLNVANKKNQHIVPRAYLKHFIDDSISKDREEFEAGVFVNSSDLDKPWKMRGLGHSLFTETRFYNLESDNPESPIIENYLAVIESHYAQAVKKLLDGEFSNEIFSILSLFVAVQFFRTKSSVKTYQKSWDKVSEWADMFEGGELNRTLYGEISLKRLLYLANTKAITRLHKCAVIIINSTRIPFLTSDKPVIRSFYNREDITKFFYPQQLKTYIGEQLESPFYFMPLAPWLAYISHNAFESEIKGVECENHNIIVQLNDLMLLNADEHIYSCINNPVASLHVVNNMSSNSDYLMVKAFTKSSRVIFEAKDYRRDSGLLILDLFNVCDELIEGEQLVSVEVFEHNFSNLIGVTGLRNCRIKTINRASKQIVFESNISSFCV